MSEREHLWADETMRKRIREERREILRHLGSVAPDLGAEAKVQVDSDDRICFMMPAEVYSLTHEGDAMRYRPRSDGAEDITFWRDGHRVVSIVKPPRQEVEGD